MPLKEKTIERMYWSIGEVADTLGVNTSLLRYWEKEFGTLRPKRTNKGDRLYTKDDVEQLRKIQHLVKEKGFTLQGAKGQLRISEVTTIPEESAPIPVDEVRSALKGIRARLIEMRGAGS